MAMLGMLLVRYSPYILHQLYCIVPLGFLPWEIRVAFSGESQLRHSRASQPTVHAEYFSVSTIHRTLAWTTGSLTRAQMLIHAIAHVGCRDTVRESARTTDSGERKIPCHTGESNLRQRRAGVTRQNDSPRQINSGVKLLTRI